MNPHWSHQNEVHRVENDFRSLYLADQQQLHAALRDRAPQGVHSGVDAGVPQRGGYGLPGVNRAVDPQGEYVGWGGQAIPDTPGSHIPWFGRNRARVSIPRARDQPLTRRRERNPQESSMLLSSRFPGREAEEALSPEDVVKIISQLPQREPLPDRVLSAMYSFDSRAVSVLLKDLSKVGFGNRSVELFDWLRNLDRNHALSALLDVYTYTAMISICIYQQNVDRAMALVDEMKERNIERNVHTFTALMNVCIKCGKLSLALDIYNSMRNVDCTPNVVTFNTLIDVYGKLGQWEKAAEVLGVMKKEGVQPVLRTYNTLIIACNMCNQPREALAVYYQMLVEGFQPNSTTYNALISAYGKIGQLDKVMEVYNEMVWNGSERSVITYSSLISACEKAGQWKLALKFFEEMQQEGCVPNTVTYNSLITACAQGAQWEKASQVFEQMQGQGCTPDVVTYTALISAFERGGQWQLALQAFQRMCVEGCRPDAIVYNAIIDALWETGITWAQSKALQLYRTAVKQGHFQQQPIDRNCPKVELNLHAMTAGVAMLSLYSWLMDIRNLVSTQAERGLPASLAIVTDKGKISKEQGNFIVKEAVASMMAFWDAPFRLVQDNSYGGLLEASSAAVAKWVTCDSFQAQIGSLFPFTEAFKPSEAALNSDELNLQREFQTSKQCSDAFALIQAFERTHSLVLPNMGFNYLRARAQLITRLLEAGCQLGIKDEVLHDAVLLMDRTVSSSNEVQDPLLSLLSTAALSICIKQGEPVFGRLPSDGDLEKVTGIASSEVKTMVINICRVLREDTSAISSLRCLKLFLERLGHSFLDRQAAYGMSGLACLLSGEALFDVSLLNCRPSVVAAAVLYAERRLRGAVPFWPSMLAKLTGYQDMATPELTMAVRSAQKLCRKLQYAQVYRAQGVALRNQGILLPQNSQLVAAIQQQQSSSVPQLLAPAGSHLALPTGDALPSQLQDDEAAAAADQQAHLDAMAGVPPMVSSGQVFSASPSVLVSSGSQATLGSPTLTWEPVSSQPLAGSGANPSAVYDALLTGHYQQAGSWMHSVPSSLAPVSANSVLGSSLHSNSQQLSALTSLQSGAASSSQMGAGMQGPSTAAQLANSGLASSHIILQSLRQAGGVSNA